MTTQSLPDVRRIVTSIDAQGRSYIASDGPSPAIIRVPERPDYCITNLWRTLGAEASVRAPDSITECTGVLPPSGGTVLRIIDFPPEHADPEERRRRADATFRAAFPDADHRQGNDRHPGMHSTTTIDYAIVLQGEIVAVLDTGDTVMKAGEVLIQRGTSHAWANRSNAIARVAFVLIDAGP
jgi:hypothetical protein